MRDRFLVALLLAVATAGSPARADWRAFLPTPVENEVYLDLLTQFERDRLENENASTRWSDVFFKEKLTFVSNGYSYSPRFVLYQFSLAGALSQETYDANRREAQGWNDGTGLEYNVRLALLPEHAYNLVVFSTRHEPLFREQAASRRESVGSVHGATFRLRRKPYFLDTSFTRNTIDSGRARSGVTNFNVNGQYFKEFTGGNQLSVSGNFNPSWFDSSLGLEGRSDEAHLDGFLNLQRARITSSVVRYGSSQQSETSGRQDSDQFAWNTFVNANLPMNFRADASYRYQDNESTLREPGSAVERRLSDTGSDVQASLSHRLYDSLGSSYTFQRSERSSSLGENSTLSHALALSYTKSIPRGHVLAGVSRGRTETDSTGQGTDIVNEAYTGIAVPTQPFVLARPNILANSLVVFLRSPLEPFENVLLDEGEHYTVRELANQNSVEILVFNLPPRFALPGTYDFLVSYTLAGGTFEVRSDTFGGNVSLQLLDNLLAPYASYVSIRSDVLSGSFPGVPVDSSTTTAGLRMTYGALRARGEYQVLDWSLGPYQSWLGEVQYIGSIGPTTRAFATATFQRRHYSEGTSLDRPEPFTEQREAFSASVQQQLRSANMSFSAGGAYSRVRGLVESQGYSISASWNWRVAKLDLSAGTSAYLSETTGSLAPTLRREHEYFFLRARRRLF